MSDLLLCDLIQSRTRSIQGRHHLGRLLRRGVLGNMGWGGLARNLWVLAASRSARLISRKPGNSTPRKDSLPTATRSTSIPARCLPARTRAFLLSVSRTRRVESLRRVGVSGPSGIIASGVQVGIIGTYRDTVAADHGGNQGRDIPRAGTRQPLGGGRFAVVDGPDSRRGSVLSHFFAGGKWCGFDLKKLA